ncbi:hypothetical protein F0365_02475 [Nonlabens sp. Ci31]|jgi:hypothetical protein|uniref:hypothetical protein n=1 Tax=Nonlabens sp. Ci31 TaxID=2608253 RepID=UPI001463DABD|nr:hypothetical protein [Nonlabens sp. Ci31]QJP33354.1 hypothetical protein F0365_02475 [Nonlabens sp. Ci31]
MCDVSDKIKFCTCVDKNTVIEELDHYWVLHRYHKDKNLKVMGLPIFPDHLHPKFEINAQVVVRALNSADAFDQKMLLEKGDRLEVVLCNNATDIQDSFYYNFRYTGTVWESIEADYFDLMSRFDEVISGQVKEIK